MSIFKSSPGAWIARAKETLFDAKDKIAGSIRRYPLAAGFVFSSLFAVFSFAFLDRPIAIACKAHLPVNLEGFFKTVTTLGLAGVYLIPLAAIWAYCRWRRFSAPFFYISDRFRRIGDAALYMFLTIALSGVMVSVLKFVIGRHRPRDLFDHGEYGLHPFSAHWSLNSFPSGHSESAFAAMTALVLIFPRYNALWLLIAALVAISRVAISVHYLGDVVFGSYMGIAAAILFAREFRRRGINYRLGDWNGR